VSADFLRLAVVGDPIGHSASPRLHRGFLAAAGRAGSYEAIRVAAGDGAHAFATLFARGYRGLNVTTPLKEEAWAAAVRRDGAALASGAVNTLFFDGEPVGANTDGIGALAALFAAGLATPAGRRVGILGTGPTARATAHALLAAGATVLLGGRELISSGRLARLLGAAVWDGTPVDAVFSTLPPGAEPAARLTRAVRAAEFAVDANYGDRATLGALLGRSDVADGAVMLAASAAASFTLFSAPGTALRRGGDSNSRDL